MLCRSSESRRSLLSTFAMPLGLRQLIAAFLSGFAWTLEGPCLYGTFKKGLQQSKESGDESPQSQDGQKSSFWHSGSIADHHRRRVAAPRQSAGVTLKQPTLWRNVNRPHAGPTEAVAHAVKRLSLGRAKHRLRAVRSDVADPTGCRATYCSLVAPPTRDPVGGATGSQ